MQLVCHVVRTISTLSESDHYDALILFCNRTIRRVLEDFRDSVREREREISECLSRQVTDWNWISVRISIIASNTVATTYLLVCHSEWRPIIVIASITSEWRIFVRLLMPLEMPSFNGNKHCSNICKQSMLMDFRFFLRILFFVFIFNFRGFSVIRSTIVMLSLFGRKQ